MLGQYEELLFGPAGNSPTILFFILIAWSVFWKGIALWKSARNKQKYWFVALLILNTIGILSIVYLAYFQNKKK